MGNKNIADKNNNREKEIKRIKWIGTLGIIIGILILLIFSTIGFIIFANGYGIAMMMIAMMKGFFISMFFYGSRHNGSKKSLRFKKLDYFLINFCKYCSCHSSPQWRVYWNSFGWLYRGFIEFIKKNKTFK